MSLKVQTCAQCRNCESGYSSVKQSSRYVTHGLYRCVAQRQHIICSAVKLGGIANLVPVCYMNSISRYIDI